MLRLDAGGAGRGCSRPRARAGHRPRPARAGGRVPGLITGLGHGPCGDWSGGDLLSRVLGRSTIGATGLNGRVRNGIGCFPRAVTTRPSKGTHRVPLEGQMSVVSDQLSDLKDGDVVPSEAPAGQTPI